MAESLDLGTGLHDLAAVLADGIAGVADLGAGCCLDVGKLGICNVLGDLGNRLIFYITVFIRFIRIALRAFFNLDAGTLAGCRCYCSFYPVVLSGNLDCVIFAAFKISTAVVGTILIVFVYPAIYIVLAVGINSSSGNHVVGWLLSNLDADFFNCPFACALIKCNNGISPAIAMASYKCTRNDDVRNAVFIFFQACSIIEIKVFIKVQSYAAVSFIASCAFPYICFAVMLIAIFVNIGSITKLFRCVSERHVLLVSFFLTVNNFMTGSTVFVSVTADYRTESICCGECNRSTIDTGFVLLYLGRFACSDNLSLCCTVYAAYGISMYVITRRS